MRAKAQSRYCIVPQPKGWGYQVQPTFVFAMCLREALLMRAKALSRYCIVPQPKGWGYKIIRLQYRAWNNQSSQT
jgi:hypothetical protein